MVRTRSLSKISSSVARQQYVDTSDEDEYPRYAPMYQQPPHRRRNSRTSSQENLGQGPPVRTNSQPVSLFDLQSPVVNKRFLFSGFQINELNKRMSAIESLLSRLEEKMTPGDEVRGHLSQKKKTKTLQPSCLILKRCRPAGVDSVGSERGGEAEEEAERVGREPER